MHAVALRVASVGRIFLTVDISVFVALLVALTIYALRRGKSDSRQGRIVSMPGRTILVSRSAEITTESLVEGTASKTDRLVAVGIQTALVCFALIFLGTAMTLLPDTGPIAILFVIVPAIWLYAIFGAKQKDVRKVQEKAKKHATKAASSGH